MYIEYRLLGVIFYNCKFMYLQKDNFCNLLHNHNSKVLGNHYQLRQLSFDYYTEHILFLMYCIMNVQIFLSFTSLISLDVCISDFLKRMQKIISDILRFLIKPVLLRLRRLCIFWFKYIYLIKRFVEIKLL